MCTSLYGRLNVNPYSFSTSMTGHSLHLLRQLKLNFFLSLWCHKLRKKITNRDRIQDPSTEGKHNFFIKILIHTAVEWYIHFLKQLTDSNHQYFIIVYTYLKDVKCAVQSHLRSVRRRSNQRQKSSALPLDYDSSQLNHVVKTYNPTTRLLKFGLNVYYTHLSFYLQ